MAFGFPVFAASASSGKMGKLLVELLVTAHHVTACYTSWLSIPPMRHCPGSSSIHHASRGSPDHCSTAGILATYCFSTQQNQITGISNRTRPVPAHSSSSRSFSSSAYGSGESKRRNFFFAENVLQSSIVETWRTYNSRVNSCHRPMHDASPHNTCDGIC